MAPSSEAEEAIDYAIKLMEDMRRRKAADDAAESLDGAAPPSQTCAAARAGTPPQSDAHVLGARFAQLDSSLPTTSTQEDAELVRAQYSRIGMSGIRALPNAMHPDFRLQLYGALVILGKERQAAQRSKRAQVMAGGAAGQTTTAHESELAAATALLLAHSTKGPALQTPVEGARGQMHPGVYSALRHIFTLYQHKGGDQAAICAEGMRTLKKQQADANLGGEFMVTAIPFAPRGACAFHEFEYMEDSQTRRDEMQWQQQVDSVQQRMGPRYLPGGKAQQRDLQKSSVASCLLHLHATLARDWPVSFVQVFEDSPPGRIVVSFHRDLAAQEGDITSYMNQHYRIDPTVQDFKLVKDTTHWGILETLKGASDESIWGVFYVYWPPWAARPKVIPPHLAGPRPKWGPALQTGVGTSSREPFGGRTDAGVLRQFDTRPHEHTMIGKGSTLMGRI